MMDTDYMEKTIYNVLVDNGIDDKKLANERKRAEKTRRNEELIVDIFNTI